MKTGIELVSLKTRLVLDGGLLPGEKGTGGIILVLPAQIYKEIPFPRKDRNQREFDSEKTKTK